MFWSSHEEKRALLELSIRGGHGRISSSMVGHGGARRRGKRGGRGGERDRGHDCGEEEGREGHHGEGLHGGGDSVLMLLGPCSLCSCALSVREEEGKRERKRKEREKEKKIKMEKFLNLEIWGGGGIKDNFWSQSKSYFCK
jgi:hypothetical protein